MKSCVHMCNTLCNSLCISGLLSWLNDFSDLRVILMRCESKRKASQIDKKSVKGKKKKKIGDWKFCSRNPDSLFSSGAKWAGKEENLSPGSACNLAAHV